MTRVFGVDYRFLSCGEVFTDGLVHAAQQLGVTYAHADWNEPTLAKIVQAFNPDLLLVVHGRRFSTRFGDRRLAGRQAVWLVDEPYEVDETSGWSKRFDVVGVNDPVTMHRHQHAVYLPTCYDPVLYTHGKGPRPYAVGFIGGSNSTRSRYLEALARAGLLTYVIGGPFPSQDVQKLCRTRNIAARETASWYQQTQIIVNIYREEHHYNAQKIPATSLNPRVYEATACGALVVSEWRPESSLIVPAMPTFRSIEECVELVRSLLDNPWELEHIRQQCMEQLAPHTYADRLRTVLEAAQLEVAA